MCGNNNTSNRTTLTSVAASNATDTVEASTSVAVALKSVAAAVLTSVVVATSGRLAG